MSTKKERMLKKGLRMFNFFKEIKPGKVKVIRIEIIMII